MTPMNTSIHSQRIRAKESFYSNFMTCDSDLVSDLLKQFKSWFCISVVFQSLHLGKITPVFILALVLVILASHGQIDK